MSDTGPRTPAGAWIHSSEALCSVGSRHWGRPGWDRKVVDSVDTWKIPMQNIAKHIVSWYKSRFSRFNQGRWHQMVFQMKLLIATLVAKYRRMQTCRMVVRVHTHRHMHIQCTDIYLYVYIYIYINTHLVNHTHMYMYNIYIYTHDILHNYIYTYLYILYYYIIYSIIILYIVLLHILLYIIY